MSADESSPKRQPLSLWWRLTLSLGGLTVLFLALGTVAYFRQKEALEAGVRRVQAELDASDPGWRLDDIEAARPGVPDAQNSAFVVLAVGRLLPGAWPGNEFSRGVEDAGPPHLLRSAQLQLLEKELQAVAPALQQARVLADMPLGRHKLVFADNPWDTVLRDQQDTRRVGMLLRYDTLARANRGDVPGALHSARGILNAGRALNDEPFLISQLIRLALVSIACADVERSLALGQADEASLKPWQKVLLQEEEHRTLEVGFRGERALAHVIWMKLLSGEIDPGQMLGADRSRTLDWRTRLLGYSTDSVRREYPLFMDLMNRHIHAARLPAHEILPALEAIEADLKILADAPLARILLPAMARTGEAGVRKIAQVRCLRVLLAVEAHRLRHKKWPDRLEDISRDLLDGIPLDPLDGKPLRYLRFNEGVSVYSVGKDRVDNGGNIVPQRLHEPGFDLGYRLWDPERRRQPP